MDIFHWFDLLFYYIARAQNTLFLSGGGCYNIAMLLLQGVPGLAGV